VLPYKAFTLEHVVVQHAEYDPTNACFKLVDNRDAKDFINLCVMLQMVKADQSIADARNQWIKDIHKFKNDCHDKQFHDDGLVPKL